jgi:hypothetical protein
MTFLLVVIRAVRVHWLPLFPTRLDTNPTGLQVLASLRKAFILPNTQS